jgi:hypothetical protein
MSAVDIAAHLSDSEYFNAAGLSNSAMHDLAVSPLRYWHCHVNPDRPKDEPTPAQQFGSALHCAVLQPELFPQQYACEIDMADYPGCLRTIEELRGWLRDQGVTPKGTRKQDVIAQVQAIDNTVPILDVIERRHFAENEGKTLLSKEDWARVQGAAKALREEPHVQRLLAEDGAAEVPMFAHDPQTGVLLKAKMDWVAPLHILDLKTFTQTRGKSIDKTIADAIFYEKYYRQAYFYDYVRRLALKEEHGACDFVLAFVESEPPHETRIRCLVPKNGGSINLYWERARIEVRGLIDLYAECWDHFGETPWRYAQQVTVLEDEEMPQLAY